MTRRLAKWIALAGVAAATAAGAQMSPDQPAALVVYPYVAVDLDAGVDTLIQLTNVADGPTDVRCFYEGVTFECQNGQPGESCDPLRPTCTGFCAPNPPGRRSFALRLTSRQPVAWRASEGLASFPLDSSAPGAGGETNGDSRVPAVGRGPTTTTLRCVAVGPDPSAPAARDVLAGSATISLRAGVEEPRSDAAGYRAIGARVDEGALDSDEVLRLGGAGAEYEPCSAYDLLDHYFWGAPLRTGDRTADVETTLVLVPCTTPSEGTIAQFSVYNEFSQRFSTSRSVPPGQLVIPLAMIDTTDPNRSIFSVAVEGTLAGRTQITSVGRDGFGGGLHALAIETHRDPGTDAVHSDIVELAGAGMSADAIVSRAPLCAGDCNLDGAVAIDEIITGIGIGSRAMPVDRCYAADRDRSGAIAIDEIVSSVASSIHGCAALEAPPTPLPTASPTASPTTTPASLGPEITHLGLAAANDRPIESSGTDDEGRPIYEWPFGQGFTLVVEARRGQSGRNVARNTYSENGSAPDLEVLASHAFGNGDPTVCERDGTAGGIPARPDLDFDGGQAAIDAMNDLGCRAFDRMPGSTPCTRGNAKSANGPFALVSRDSQQQFCIPITRAWALPEGDTIVAARVRDVTGNFGEPREIVLRIGRLP